MRAALQASGLPILCAACLARNALCLLRMPSPSFIAVRSVRMSAAFRSAGRGPELPHPDARNAWLRVFQEKQRREAKHLEHFGVSILSQRYLDDLRGISSEDWDAKALQTTTSPET